MIYLIYTFIINNKTWSFISGWKTADWNHPISQILLEIINKNINVSANEQLDFGIILDCLEDIQQLRLIWKTNRLRLF